MDQSIGNASKRQEREGGQLTLVVVALSVQREERL